MNWRANAHLFSTFLLSLPTRGAWIEIDDEAAFHQAFQDAIQNIVRQEPANDPVHHFMIGLAFLDGIDVEINAEYGVELITKAAEAELPEAMEKLYDMFENGKYVALDYQKAQYWAEKVYRYNREQYGEEHPDLLDLLTGCTDIMSVLMILLPLYPEKVNGSFTAVSLLRFTQISFPFACTCWSLFIMLLLIGVCKLLMHYRHIERGGML